MLNERLLEASKLFAEKYHVTKRELDVLNLFLEGMSPEEVATHLKLSLNTVRNHVKGLFRGTQTNSIGKILAKFVRETLV